MFNSICTILVPGHCPSMFIFIFYLSFQAKALAEKNQRDILAQKEQTERDVNFLDMNRCSYGVNDVNMLVVIAYACV